MLIGVKSTRTEKGVHGCPPVENEVSSRCKNIEKVPKRRQKKTIRDRNRGVVGSYSLVFCCKMEHEELWEEMCDNEIEIGLQEELVGVIVPKPVHISLEVQVFPSAGNPESLSPSLPLLESSSQQVEDAPNFMGFFTSDDLLDLEQ